MKPAWILRFITVGSKFYIEISGVEAGMPLTPEERKDPDLLKARKEFIKEAGFTY